MYDTQAQLIIEDLQLQKMKFVFEWYAGKYIPGTKRYRGYSTTYRDNVSTLIQVACGWGYKQAIITLAHELRHSWQFHNGVCTQRVNLYVWRGGTQYAPGARTWRPLYKFNYKAYQAQPHEVDARGYADDVWRRLFEGNAPKKGPKPRSVSKLDDFFL